MVLQYLPHRRYLPEDFESNSHDSNGTGVESVKSENEKVLTTSETTELVKTRTQKKQLTEEEETVKEYHDPVIAVLEDDNGQEYPVREFRDEAGKTWFQSLNEFEYRETKTEASKYKWWR